MNTKKDQRRQPRLRVTNMNLIFNNRACKVFNINECGVAFSINTPREVVIGVEIDSIVIDGNDPVSIAGIARHISHISQIDADADVRAEWVCGAEFQFDKKPEAAERVKTLIKRTTD